MTNTQSPAPGVAAILSKLQEQEPIGYSGVERNDVDVGVTRDAVLRWVHADEEDEPLYSLAQIRTALQASAAAVEPVAWMLEHDGFTHYSGGRVPSQRTLILKKPSPEQERYYEGCKTLKFTPLYTAPPLPAQVQEAEGDSYEDLWNALQQIDTAAVTLPTFKVTHEGGIKAVAQNIVEAILASRTPAPGMAGGVERVLRSQMSLIVQEAMACGRMRGGRSVQLDRLLDQFHATLESALSTAPHPSPAPQAAGAEKQQEPALCDCGRPWGEPHHCAYQNGHDIYANDRATGRAGS